MASSNKYKTETQADMINEQSQPLRTPTSRHYHSQQAKPATAAPSVSLSQKNFFSASGSFTGVTASIIELEETLHHKKETGAGEKVIGFWHFCLHSGLAGILRFKLIIRHFFSSTSLAWMDYGAQAFELPRYPLIFGGTFWELLLLLLSTPVPLSISISLECPMLLRTPLRFPRTPAASLARGDGSLREEASTEIL